jgi:hypothetical protein
MTAQEKAQTIVEHATWYETPVFNVRDLSAGVWAAIGAMAHDVVDHGSHRTYSGENFCGLPWTVEVRR